MTEEELTALLDRVEEVVTAQDTYKPSFAIHAMQQFYAAVTPLSAFMPLDRELIRLQAKMDKQFDRMNELSPIGTRDNDNEKFLAIEQAWQTVTDKYVRYHEHQAQAQRIMDAIT